jgi:hypothetical protein
MIAPQLYTQAPALQLSAYRALANALGFYSLERSKNKVVLDSKIPCIFRAHRKQTLKIRPA